MKHTMSFRFRCGPNGRRLGSYAALALLLGACGGGAVVPAAAVGKVGGSLSSHAHNVPQGAEVCALKEAIEKPPGKRGSVMEPCEDGLKSDQLWRGSMGVLAAYGRHLEAVSAGADPQGSGKLQAAMTGIRGQSWIDVEDGVEKAARTAAANLVDQLGKSTADSELEEIVKAAAPHVTTLCDGLEPYLEAQAQTVGELRKQLPEKEKAPSSRRCAMLDNRSICMADNVVDRMTYAGTFGHLASLESSHRDARNAVAAFCAAHAKLEKAAKAGELSDDETGHAVAAAVKDAIPERSEPSEAAEGGEAQPGAQPAPGGNP